MTSAKPNPPRLARLAPKDDPGDVAGLFQSAQAAPIEDLPRLRWRIRTTLHHKATRPRRLLRIALVTGMIFLMGGVVGAVVRPFWERRAPAPQAIAEETAPPPVKATRRSTAQRAPEIMPEAPPVAPEAPSPIDPITAETTNLPSLSAIPPTRRRLTNPNEPAKVEIKRPSPSAPRETPDPVPTEQRALGEIIALLRKQHAPLAALALLDEHRARFAERGLSPEADMLRVEALLAVGRNADALAVLDRLPLGSLPKRDERFVLRGELRAAAGRWQAAQSDFAATLANLDTTSAHATKRDVNERALWGRAAAKSHLHDEVGARADLTLYLRLFPAGRFATPAAAILQGPP